MKTTILTSALLLTLLISCNKKAESNDTEIEAAPVEAPVSSTEVTGIECYKLANAMDTIKLSLMQNANNVNGELQYNLNQKDRNVGTISGIFIGDTLFADYTFKSEGKTSVRETVFVKKDSTMVQGSGEMEEKNGKACFKNPKKLVFDQKVVLTKSDCN